MAKAKTQFVCQNCGYHSPRFWADVPTVASGTHWLKKPLNLSPRAARRGLAFLEPMLNQKK